MEGSFSCFMNKWMEMPLQSGQSLRHTGWDMMEMIPYMAIPLLLVLIAGLYLIDLHRKHRSSLGLK
jgi:hypothetical protein